MQSPSLKKSALIAAAAVAAYTLAGFLGVPPLAKWLAQKKLTELLQRQVTIEDIDLNPFALTATVKGFSVKNREGVGDLAAFESLYANLQGISLFRLGVVIREVRLKSPRLGIARLEPGRYNFSDLIPAAADAPAAEKPPGRGLRFSVNNIEVLDGRVEFRDDPVGKTHRVSGLTLTLPFISNFDAHVETFVEPLLSAEVNGKPIALRGKARPFASPVETVFDIDLADVDIPYYLAYIPAKFNFKVPSALLDVKASLSFVNAAEPGPSLVISGEAALKAVAVTDTGGAPLLGLERLQVSVAPSDLLAGNLHLARVALERPQVTLERNSAGAFNFQPALPAAPAGDAPPSAAPPRQPDITVDEIAVDGGRLAFADHSQGPPFETTLEPIRLRVSGFANRGNRPAAMDLSLSSESGETVALTGQFSIAPLTASGTVSLARAVLAKYAPYYDDYARFSVESGTLDFQTGFEVDLGQETPGITLADLSTRLLDLKLKQTGAEKGFLDIPEMSVSGTSVDLNRRSVAVGEILSRNGRLSVKRLKLGDLDIQQLFEAPRRPPSAADSPGAGAAPPWQVTLHRLLIDQYAIEGEDHTFAKPVRMLLDQARLQVDNFSTAARSRADVSFSGRYNQKGSLLAGGRVGIDPLEGDLELKIAGHEPVWFQKYFEDQVRVIATGGRIDAGGTLSFAMTGEKGLTLSYRGGLKVADFKSVERANADEFLSFKKLEIDDARIAVNPTSVSIGKISLHDFFSRLVLTPEGRLNVQDTVATGGAKAGAPKTARAEATPPVKIGTVALSSGRVRFIDRFVAPGYSATLTGIDGTLKGLSTDRAKAADVQLRARLDGQAPLQISGKVNPLADELFADIAVKFDEMDLSSLSPYSGKFAGYTIQKGKLFLDLSYRIEKKSLQSRNSVLLDQLEFGKRVESPTATALPVTLAVALLKDRSGKISLDLPVSGRLDDPQFSVAGIILQMIVNLLVKAATSPFALVTAVLGGGEELDQIEFAYGISALDEAGGARLDRLAEVLYERPGLKLDISGYADSEKDSQGLADALFENRLKAQKLKDLSGRGQAAGSLEEVALTPEEYERYLAAAFAEAGLQLPARPAAAPEGKKPPPETGAKPAADSPAAEMERLLRAGIRVAESDLRILARARAQAVKEHLLQSGKVTPERIFLNDPGDLKPPPAEGMKDSRVVMALK